MGNIIVVRDADFSAVAVDHVEILSGWRNINLSLYPNTTQYLSLNYGWQDTGFGKLVPVGSATKVRFTANSQNKGQIVFATDVEQSSATAISVVVLEVGETSEDVDIPSNAMAIFVGYEWSGQNRTPASFKLFYP